MDAMVVIPRLPDSIHLAGKPKPPLPEVPNDRLLCL
jgi:hypothetical protein